MSNLDKELYDAVRQNKLAEVRILLGRGASVNYKDGYYIYELQGYTPLHEAAKQGNVKIADLLIRNKANVNATDSYGSTPLYTAVGWGNIEVADLLIRNKADVNAPDTNGVTPLHKAAIPGNVEVADLLIRNGAVVNAPDNVEATPLHKVAVRGNVKVADILIRNGAVVNAPDNVNATPLQKAVVRGYVEFADLLSRNGAVVNVSDHVGDTPLHIAAVHGDVEVTDMLIRNEADVNAPDNDGDTPLHKSAFRGDVKVTDLLIRNQADVNARDNVGATPLHSAAKRGNVKVTDLLIRNKAGVNSPDNDGATPLHSAAKGGNVEITDLLIKNKAVVNATDKNGATPLHSAAKGGNVEVTDLLIKNKAVVNATDKNGATLLHSAAKGGNVEVTDLLIRNKACVNATDNDGATPLHSAAKGWSVEVTDLLIRNKAGVNATDNDGRTPLHDAPMGGNIKLTELLIGNNADVNATDNVGNSPLHMAVIYEKENIVTTLITLGADPSAKNNEGKTPIDLAEDMYAHTKKSLKAYTYRKIINSLKGNSDNLSRTRQQSRVIVKTKAQTKDTMASPSTMQSNTSKGKNIQLPWLVDAGEFKRMLSQGTFLSYENRLSLGSIYMSQSMRKGGPCRAGKSTLARVLIGEKIPVKWNSTDGLVIYFGRNGIDIDQKKMVPLKKGDRGHEVYAKLLRGKPHIVNKSEQTTTPASKYTPKNPNKNNSPISLLNEEPIHKTVTTISTNELATNQTHASIAKSDLQHEGTARSSKCISLKTDDIQTLEFQKLKLQSDILDEVRTGQYKIDIAPSDLIDFGGQKSYDMTHQLFIQHKGSFLLMFDGRYGLHTQLEEYLDGVTAASILKHWVDSILTYTEDTKDIMPMIMFAATHRDKCMENTETLRTSFTRDIKQMFSKHEKQSHIHLDVVYFINGTDEKDVELQLMTDQIVMFAIKQSSWGQRRPIQWVPLELQISNMRMKNVNIIRKEDLRNVNMMNGDLALSEPQLNDFLQVQHSLGKLMYYHLPGLNSFVIIHPPALVNILRSFVTDEQFFPADQNLKTILQNLIKTGTINKTDLLQLWQQDIFHQYMQNDSIKEFVILLLQHLDILIIPKQSKQTNVYLVPCMIKAVRPSNFNVVESQKENTICLRYTIARHSIPTSLAYKIVGASICAWPLKYEDKQPCLYHKAALLNVSEDNELRIWIEDNHVNVMMTNELALIHMSPDVAASVQECLTKNLESSLLFHYNSFGKQMEPAKASELYTIELGVPCGHNLCYTSLQDAIMNEEWICGQEINHNTRYLRYWVFNKNKTTCGPDCKGLNDNEIRTEPSDKHLVRLGSQIGITLFDEFFINLKMDRRKWESIAYTYTGHSPEGIMSMALVKWKECKLEDMEDPTLNDLSDALSAMDLDTHAICQVFRENMNLQDIADFKLHETPEDDILRALSNQIGNCALQLGIELGVSFHEVENSFVKFPKDLPGLLEDILKKWKAGSKVPTFHSLMMALTRVNGGGVRYLRKLLS